MIFLFVNSCAVFITETTTVCKFNSFTSAEIYVKFMNKMMYFSLWYEIIEDKVSHFDLYGTPRK